MIKRTYREYKELFYLQVCCTLIELISSLTQVIQQHVSSRFTMIFQCLSINAPEKHIGSYFVCLHRRGACKNIDI